MFLLKRDQSSHFLLKLNLSVKLRQVVSDHIGEVLILGRSHASAGCHLGERASYCRVPAALVENLFVCGEPIVAVPDDVVVICNLQLQLLELLLLAHALGEERFVVRVLLVRCPRLWSVVTAFNVTENLDVARGRLLSALRQWCAILTLAWSVTLRLCLCLLLCRFFL